MRSRLLLLAEPNDKAYAFRSIPWGARAIKSGCTRKKYEESTESLIRANPNSAGVFEISHVETNAHDLIRQACIGPSFWLLICVLDLISYKHTQFI